MDGIIRWFSGNHVAANLLMLVIVGAGIMSVTSIKQEVFPVMEMDMISINVPYLGATPSEVEEAICVRIEEKIQGIENIKKINSTATEGFGSVLVEMEKGSDITKAHDDIKAAVDRIITFPAETEKPVISIVENKNQAIDVIVYGDTSELTIKKLAENIRDDILALEDVTYAVIAGTRPYEISIEVSEENLRALGLNLSQVTAAVRANSLDLPGGSVKTSGGEILIRTKGQRYTGEEFGKIVVITAPDGTEVTLDQLAIVRDSFEDIDKATYIDGKPAALVSVFRTGDQGVLTVTGAVKEYVEGMQENMPAGIQIDTWHDRSIIYKGRMDLLLKNGAIGLLLVFLCLAISLEMRLALWVSVGIGISFLGAFWVIPWFDTSLNMISMFAFIVSLGIVVDDAIVVGENVYAHRQMGRKGQDAATLGTLEVSGPVIFAVLTTVVAFLPLAFVDGIMGKFMINIPVVVIAILLFSLVESLWILPAHLASMPPIRTMELAGSERPTKNPYVIFKKWFNAFSERLIHGLYKDSLELAIKNKTFVIAVAIASLLMTAGWVAGGHLKFTFMPNVDADNLVAALTLPQGTTVDDAYKAVRQLEVSLEEVREHYDSQRPDDAPSIVIHVSTNIGSQPKTNERNPDAGGGGAHLVEVNAELLVAEERDIPSREIIKRWREVCGPITGAVSLSFSSDLFHGGRPIYVQMSSANPEDLNIAGAKLKSELAAFPGVTDIADSFREGKVEMKLSLKPEARTLGITLNDLARQVRAGFYGDEAMRIQRGRDEVKVMIRYPQDERKSLGNIESMRIRTPAGVEVPFTRVAQVDIGRGYAAVNRADRNRVVSVTAEIDQTTTNAEEINTELVENIMPAILKEFPGLRYSMEGQERDRADSMASLGRGFIFAMMMIFVLLAVLFKSYTQPLVVMLAIPFGLVGAIWGHIITGIDLTLISLFGVVALTGVVVNDSLIMIDFINRARREGASVQDAVVNSGLRRFRPIMLTSVTTFAGLSPLLLEKSMQARFLIPMATSLGFGIIFATMITLIIVPVGYIILVNFKLYFGFEKPMAVNQPAEETAVS